MYNSFLLLGLVLGYSVSVCNLGCMLFACQNGSIDVCSVVLGLLVTEKHWRRRGLKSTKLEFSTFVYRKHKCL